MHCPHCGQEVSENAKACGHCGQWLTPPAVAPQPEPFPPSATEAPQYCPHCGQTVSANARVCGHCGQQLVTVPPVGPSQPMPQVLTPSAQPQAVPGRKIPTWGWVIGGLTGLLVLVGLSTAGLLYSRVQARSVQTVPTRAAVMIVTQALPAAPATQPTATPQLQETATAETQPADETATAQAKETVAAEAVANRKATEQAQAEETATAQVEATAMIEALNIVLQDDFSSNVNDWREGKRQGDAGQSNFQFVDGKYRVWVKANDSISSWANVNNLLLKDFWLRVEARLIERSGDDPGDTNVSIIFRQNEGDKGHTDYYRVMFYDDSTYRVQLRQDGEWHTVLDRTASRFFKLEPGETNTFSILAEGPKITIYANDQKLHTITDAALSEAGYIGIGLRVSEDGQTATVDFDNLVIRGEPVASADTGGGATPTLVPAKPTATPQVLPAKITKGQIAFVSKRDGNDELYTMDADGSNQQRLTNTPDIIEWLPSWSPDGARLVFECMTKDVSMSNICVINADGSGYSQITNWGQDDWKAHRAVWSPDGQKIAVGGNKGGQNSVILMNADGSNQTVIAEGGYPHWSPDGKQIVFIAWKGFEDQIKVVNIDGSNLRILSQGDEDRLYPTWSPDGSQIAFDYDRAQVVVIDAAGGTEQLIVDKTSFNLSWSSDGQRILIAPYEGLWVVNVDGSGLTQLTQEGTQPAWYTGH